MKRREGTGVVHIRNQTVRAMSHLFSAIAIAGMLGSFPLVTVLSAGAGTFETLAEDLKSPQQKRRFVALDELSRLKDERVFGLLMNLVGNRLEDWELQVRAIRILGGTEKTEVAELLLEIYNDPFRTNECPALKWNIISVLGNFRGNQRVVETLLRALHDSDIVVREAAVQSLGKAADANVAPSIIPLLYDKSYAIRLSTVRALGQLKNQESVRYLRWVISNDKDIYMRNEATAALQNILSEGKP